jgi:putative lipoic acid-binding regulatory protein
MEIRASKTAKYISLTCTIRATSRKQLDAVYQELCDHPLVKMVL